MGEVRLDWNAVGRGCYEAAVDPLDLHAWVDGRWCVELLQYPRTLADGKAADLAAAQLAAESAAVQWLSEGVTALGGRVLAGDEVDGASEAVDYYIDAFESDWLDDASRRYRALARKLGGERG